MHRATLFRRREEARDRASLDSSKTVANVGGELELLGLDCTLQPVAELVRSSPVGNDSACRRLVSPTDVLRAAMNTAQQVAHALLERVVAMRASKTSRRTEVTEGRGA